MVIMEKAQRQLQQVQRLSRGLLVARPLLQWVVMVVVTALVLGLLDYLLHLPSWVRLVAGLLTAGALLLWLVLQLRQAAGLKIDMTALALRAEQLYPQLSGVLASGVEFAFGNTDADASPRTLAMTRRSIEQANTQLAGVQLTRLIDPAPTMRIALVAAATAILFVVLAAAWPAQVWLGTQRWLSPFANVHWPKRTSVQSLMTQTHWPSDTPLRLKARVSKGHYPGMRIWAAHRVIDAKGNAGAWQSQLMSEQTAQQDSLSAQTIEAVETTAGLPENAPDNRVTAERFKAGVGDFERVIDAMASNAAGATSTASATSIDSSGRTSVASSRRPVAVEFQFSSSDDQTITQRVELIERPALSGMSARLEPPAYAQGLVAAQTIDLHAASGQVVTARALAGSKVTLTLTFNKPLPVSRLSMTQLFPTRTINAPAPAAAGQDTLTPNGLTLSQQRQGEATTDTLTLTFDLDEPWQSTLALVDGFGLTSLSQRAYRFEPVVDAPPSVSVTQPTVDESVLASAVMELAASVQDDVGALALTLDYAKINVVKVEVEGQPEALASTTLARASGRQPALSVTHTLDLAPLKLEPGSTLEIWATGQDIYEQNGQRHDIVKSPVRKITIIDPAALAGRLVQELASVRQQAVRLENQQRALMDNPARLTPGQLKAQQTSLSQRITSQLQVVEHLTQRQERNRLDDPELARLLAQAQAHLDQAKAASESAESKLSAAQQSDPQANASQSNQSQTTPPNQSQGSPNTSDPGNSGQTSKSDQAAQPSESVQAGDAAKQDAQADATSDAQKNAQASQTNKTDKSADANKSAAAQAAADASKADQAAQAGESGEAGESSEASKNDAQATAASEAQKNADAAKAGKSGQSAESAQSSPAQQSAQQQMDQARADQQKTSEALAKLVELLDQGQDAMALQMQLQQLAKRQAELAQKTREMLPKTMGKTADQLSDQEKNELAQMAKQQQAMQQQAQAMIQKMQAAAQSMSKPQNSARQQAAAQALSQAAQTAQQQGLDKAMQDSAQQTQENQLGNAAKAQEQAQATMESMLQQMNNQQAMQQEILKRQMEKLAAAVRQLIEQQKQQIEAVDKAKQADGALEQLDAPALTLRRNTASVQEQMTANSELQEPAGLMEQSAKAQASAVESMRAKDAQQAKTAQQQSLAHLETALRKLEEKKKDQKQREEEAQRAELRKQYEALAQLQKEISEKTRTLLSAGELDRQQRSQVASLGQEEAQLQAKANTLRQEVADMVVFEHLHRRIDQKAGQAADYLKQLRSLARVSGDQKVVENTLRQLADALKEPPKQLEEFSKGEGGGGEGGEGGEPGDPPLIPPLAELRLLRDVQQSLYEETRAFDDAKGALSSQAQVREETVELSGRQRELAALGDKLIEQLKEKQGGSK